MLDIINNEYWIDESNTPLSILEIRDKVALREFCTPVETGDQIGDLQGLQEKNYRQFFIYR